jgi:cytochrome c oxidase subunit III
MPTKVREDIELIIENIGGGGGRGVPPADEFGGGDEWRNRKPSKRVSPKRYYTGVAVVIISVLMFFMALASAYVVRKGASSDWITFRFPGLIWINTAILLASSATLEVARRRLAREDLSAFRSWWSVTTVLGCVFLAGQILVWRELLEQGVYLASNPASSFFYVFTGAHAVHIVAGVGALSFVALGNFDRTRISRSTAVGVTSYFWHFLDGLWVFLALLLYAGR